MRPFRYPVTILNTIDHLGKFDGKADEGFCIGYSTYRKEFRVFNSRTRIVEENMHVKFSETTPNIARSGPNWLFDIDALTISMNYKLVVVGNQSNGSACTKACDIIGKTRVGTVPDKDYILLPLWTEDPLLSSSSKDSPGAGYKPSGEEEKKDTKYLGNEDSEAPITEEPRVNQEKDNVYSTNRVNTVSSTVNAASSEVNDVDRKLSIKLPDDLNIHELEDITIFEDSNEDVFGAKADLNNLESTFQFIYTSYIEQFCTTTKAKNINGEAQIHAKVDRKKVIISEASIIRDLRFGDEGEPPFTDHMKAIYNLDVSVDSKAPKPSSQTKEDTKSSSVKDKSPSHPSPPTPVVAKMHKKAQQAAGGPTSLGATSKEGSHPQLSSGYNLSFLIDKTKSAGDRLKTAHTDSGENKESRADDILLKVKLVDLSDILKDTRSAFFTPDSLPDEPIIISYKSEEEEEVARDKDTKSISHEVHLLQSQKEELKQTKVKAKAEVSSMKAKPSYLDINQLTELLVTSLKPERSKLLASHDFFSCLPTKLKELTSKIIGLSGEIKELKKHVKDMEIELPGVLKEIPKKLETFTSTISSLSS
nr:retrovirus-related Pol polyprotein from transposon TNT 1-94 [Tanacetum cinerariifolium]